jgi:excisionase family DNA binding protein
MEKKLINVKDLAMYLSLPKSSIYALVQKKEIPFKRIGEKSIRFDLSDINKWIEEQSNASYYRN